MNYPPQIKDFKVDGNQDETVWFRKSDFYWAFNDVDHDQLKKIKITEIPHNGVLKISGTLVSNNQEIVDLDKL